MVLALVAGLYWVAHSMLRPLIAPYALTLGASPLTAGLAVGAFSLLPSLLAIATGFLGDFFGNRRLLQFGSAGMVASGVLLVLLDGPGLLILSQVIAGTGMLAMWLAIQSLMTFLATETGSVDERNKRITNLSLFVSGGQLAGPLLGGFVADAAGYRSSFAVFLMLSGLVALASQQIRDPVPPQREQDAGDFGRRLLNSHRVALDLLRQQGVFLTAAISFLALFLIDMRIAFFPVYLGEVGFSPLWIGLLLSTSGAFAFLSRPILPALLRRLRTSLVVGFSLVTGALAIGSVALTETLWALFALAAVAGAALGFTQPLTLALISDHTPKENRGIGVGLRVLANRSATWIEPLAFSLLLSLVGIRPTFVYLALAIAGLSLIVALALSRLEKKG
ncbi:MFS transporter [Rubrobacter taiwanensis]|jgi:MFS family permease|nr:MFS transporter [Rubrobacter taiwanensis]